MPRDNDSLINDILNELDNKSKSKTEASSEIEKNNIRKYEKAVEHEISAETEASVQDAEISNSVHSADPQEDFINKAFDDSKRKLHEAEKPELTATAVRNRDTHQPDKSAPAKRKKRKRRKQRSRLPGVLILTVFIFAVSISLSLVIIAFGKDVLGIGKSETTHLVVIQEGATTEQISLMLKDEGIIKSPKCFQLFSKLRKSDSSYIPGEHFIRANMAYETIIEELTSTENENKESVEVMFKEGITLIDAAALLEENGVCSADEFIFYFNSGGYGFEFENKLNLASDRKFYRMEGYLFPDTYFFYKDMSPEEVCQKIYLNFDNKMTDNHTNEDRYKRMEELNLTLDQLITFASMVQAEACTVDSMKMVASVFWNRLNNPDTYPKLESDPTENYANDVIRPHMEVFDQATIDAYNTLIGPGLPPGAICNPGIEAIDAVLAAVESDYFFFNANINTKEVYYAKTYEEHLANLEMVEQQYADAQAAEEAANNAR